MIRQICSDQILLSQPAQPATLSDVPILDDLMDTLSAHSDHCVGMAANMIGIPKRIIAVSVGPITLGMLNPIITQRSEPYSAEEGCLSLTGLRRTTRYRKIEVHFQSRDGLQQKQAFSGYLAQIIQHEIDHCDGILI